MLIAGFPSVMPFWRRHSANGANYGKGSYEGRDSVPRPLKSGSR